MPIATLRLTAAEKRTFTAEARRRGLTLSEYLRTAAQKEAGRARLSFGAIVPGLAGIVKSGRSDLSMREGLGD
jgi:hypothetical protein